MERTGWWFKIDKILLNRNNHPVCAVSVSLTRHFLDRAATPAGQEGRWLAS
jgi:hypothetical protein